MPAWAATAQTGLPTTSTRAHSALFTSLKIVSSSSAPFPATSPPKSACVAPRAVSSPAAPWTSAVTSSASAFCGMRASGFAFICRSSSAISSSGRSEKTFR